MPYIKFLIITLLLTSFSFSESEIINPFTNPSVIQGNSQQIDVEPNYQEDNVPPSSSDIINPFKDPSVIVKDSSSQEEEIQYPKERVNQETNIFDKVDIQEVEQQSSQSYDNTPHYQPSDNQALLDARALPKKDNSDYNTIAPNIEGRYRLVEGSNPRGVGVRKAIEEGYLVIERLDDKNYGYYYAFISELSKPKGSFGIFNYDKGCFNQRIISEEGTVKTINLDNTKIITDGNKLELDMNIGDASLNSIWEDDSIGSPSPKLQKSLKEAKKSYKEIYKDKFSQLRY